VIFIIIQDNNMADLEKVPNSGFREIVNLSYFDKKLIIIIF